MAKLSVKLGLRINYILNEAVLIYPHPRQIFLCGVYPSGGRSSAPPSEGEDLVDDLLERLRVPPFLLEAHRQQQRLVRPAAGGGEGAREEKTGRETHNQSSGGVFFGSVTVACEGFDSANAWAI